MTLSLKTIKHRAGMVCMAALLALPLSTGVQAEDFTESQLKSFVVAVAAINQIAEKWQPQVQAAQSEDQAAEMLQQVDTEMRQAIESTDGIGIDEYQSIMKAAQTDEALKSQIETLMKDTGAN